MALAYRELPRRGLGGCVHVILEDPNYGQAIADSCAANAGAWEGGEYQAQDIALAQALAAMTTTQRRNVARRVHVHEGRRWREYIAQLVARR